MASTAPYEYADLIKPEAIRIIQHQPSTDLEAEVRFTLIRTNLSE